MATASTHLQSNQLAQWNAWKSGPRPRTVHLKHRFWCALLLVTCLTVPSLLLGFLIAEWRTSPARQLMNSDFWSAMPFILLPLIFFLLAFWILVGQKRLVSDGEISIGKVTAVRLRRRGHAITYEFLDRSGRLITASCPDNTRSFSLGMVVPIFYNPQSPSPKRWDERTLTRWQHLLKREHQPCAERISLTKECRWKDGDRGGLADWELIHGKKKMKVCLDINRPSHGSWRQARLHIGIGLNSPFRRKLLVSS